jgi:uncharacterized protein YbjQ (UPF0145 family)
LDELAVFSPLPTKESILWLVFRKVNYLGQKPSFHEVKKFDGARTPTDGCTDYAIAERTKLLSCYNLNKEKHMIITTTPSVQGKEIKEYYGIVTGEAILGANVFKDFFAGIRDIVGGRSAAYEKELERARTIAMQELTEQAEVRGADAIVGVDIDYETVGSGSMLMVTISGTAVRLG